MVLFSVIGALVVAAVIVAAGMSLFVRRHGEADRPGPGWAPTDEVFVDPVTNRRMRVWSDALGERHYLPDTRGHGTSNP